jgi:hypothetical protein
MNELYKIHSFYKFSLDSFIIVVQRAINIVAEQMNPKKRKRRKREKLRREKKELKMHLKKRRKSKKLSRCLLKLLKRELMP